MTDSVVEGSICRIVSFHPKDAFHRHYPSNHGTIVGCVVEVIRIDPPSVKGYFTGWVKIVKGNICANVLSGELCILAGKLHTI